MIKASTPQSPQAVAAHYDNLDEFYRDIWGEHLHHGLWLSGNETTEQAVRQLVEQIVDLGCIRPGYRVCDVGCGYGATARMLVKDFGAYVEGFTISKTQYDYACSLTTEQTRFFCQDWLENELPVAAFDTVIAIECLSHIENKVAFFDQAFRILRPGGQIVICAWLVSDQHGSWMKKHLLEPICQEGRLPAMGSANDYRNLIHSSGLKLRAFQDISHQVWKTWPIIAWRLAGRLATRREYRRFVLHSSNVDRMFAVTVLRIWTAYRIGCMRYGIFVAEKPS